MRRLLSGCGSYALTVPGILTISSKLRCSLRHWQRSVPDWRSEEVEWAVMNWPRVLQQERVRKQKKNQVQPTPQVKRPTTRGMCEDMRFLEKQMAVLIECDQNIERSDICSWGFGDLLRWCVERYIENKNRKRIHFPNANNVFWPININISQFFLFYIMIYLNCVSIN